MAQQAGEVYAKLSFDGASFMRGMKEARTELAALVQTANQALSLAGGGSGRTRDWGRAIAGRMRSDADEVVRTWHDSMAKVFREKQSRYRRLGELGAEGFAAVRDVHMFDEDRRGRGGLQPANMRSIYADIIAARKRENAERSDVQSALFGGAIDAAERIGQIRTSAGGVKGAINESAAAKETNQLIRQMLAELKRINQPAVSS